MINVTVVGLGKIRDRLDKMPSSVQQVLYRKMTELCLRLQAHIQQDKLSGQVLNVVTGALRRSIATDVSVSGDTVLGRVFSSGDVKYAAIHEFGGVIKHPGGTPYVVMGAGFRSAKQEAIFGNGGSTVVFVSKASAEGENLPVTRPHDINMPERSFMRSSMADMKQQIIRELVEAANRAARAEGGAA